MNEKHKFRQLIPMKSWNAKARKQTDPHYSSRVVLRFGIARYVHECLENDEEPELFISLWVDDEKGTASLGLAVPYDYVSPKNRVKREEFEQWDH